MATRVTRPAARRRARWVETRGCASPRRVARSLTVASPSSRAARIASRDGSPRAPATRATSCIAPIARVVYRPCTYLLSEIYERHMTRPSSPSGGGASGSPADPIAAVTHPDPYPYYRALVARAPLYRDEALGLWVAASAHAVTAALTSPLGRVRPAAEPVPAALVASPAADVFGRLARMTDGPGHAGLGRCSPRPRPRRPLGPESLGGDRPALEPGAGG